MKIVWSDQALSHLVGIETDAKERMSTESTSRLMARLILSAEQLLEDFPNMGRQVREKGFEEYQELILKPYLIVYRINGEYLEISGVHHGAQNRDKVLQELLGS